MRKNKKSILKRGMAVMMLACMLFTVGRVNSKTDDYYGIMPCGEELERDSVELI